jgi:hypothetical protein
MRKIAEGLVDKQSVLEQLLADMRIVFRRVLEQAQRLDDAIAVYFPPLGANDR